MFQSCQTWPGNHNNLGFVCVASTSLDYWAQATTMSCYYHFPCEPDNCTGRKSLCDDSWTHRKGGWQRAQTHSHLESFSSTPSKSQHRCSQHLRSSQNHATMKLDWGRALRRNTPIFPKVFAHTLRSCPFWDNFHFPLLWSVLLKKKDPYRYPLYLETPFNV